jgi:hypothetical protein
MKLTYSDRSVAASGQDNEDRCRLERLQRSSMNLLEAMPTFITFIVIWFNGAHICEKSQLYALNTFCYMATMPQ